MDTFTHGIVGALIGKAFFGGEDRPALFLATESSTVSSSPTARAAIVACTVGSIFPDIDVFAGAIAKNPLAIIEWHRNITHSLVVLPLWAVLLTVISRPLARRAGWQLPSGPKLAGIFAAGLLSHIFLDLITNFGTMAFSPINYSRPAWDWIFIVDFTVSGVALAPQLAAWCFREPEKFLRRAAMIWALLAIGVFAVYEIAQTTGFGFSPWVVRIAGVLLAMMIFAPRIGGVGFRWKRANWCRAAFAALCIYIGSAASAHRIALSCTEAFAAAHHLRVENLAALPLPPTLTHWAGVVSTPEGVWRASLRLPGGKIENSQFYETDVANQFVSEAKGLRDVQIYLWFARFPIWNVEHLQDETIAEVTDVRFFRRDLTDWGDDPPPAERDLKTRAASPGFTFQVVFDAEGKIISHGFKRPE